MTTPANDVLRLLNKIEAFVIDRAWWILKIDNEAFESSSRAFFFRLSAVRQIILYSLFKVPFVTRDYPCEDVVTKEDSDIQRQNAILKSSVSYRVGLDTDEVKNNLTFGRAEDGQDFAIVISAVEPESQADQVLRTFNVYSPTQITQHCGCIARDTPVWQYCGSIARHTPAWQAEQSSWASKQVELTFIWDAVGLQLQQNHPFGAPKKSLRLNQNPGEWLTYTVLISCISGFCRWVSGRGRSW